MKKLFNKVVYGLPIALLTAANAFAGSIRVDDFRNTSGASGKDITNVMQKQTQTAQSALDLTLILAGLAGLVITVISLLVLYKASKEEGREKPMGAVWGLFIGGALTIVGLITGLFGNTLAV